MNDMISSGRPNTSFGRIFGRIVGLNQNRLFGIGNATETEYLTEKLSGIYFYFFMVKMVLLLIFCPIFCLWLNKAHLRFCVKISGASHFVDAHSATSAMRG
jgi:hypothetical protein